MSVLPTSKYSKLFSKHPRFRLKSKTFKSGALLSTIELQLQFINDNVSIFLTWCIAASIDSEILKFCRLDFRCVHHYSINKLIDWVIYQNLLTICKTTIIFRIHWFIDGEGFDISHKGKYILYNGFVDNVVESTQTFKLWDIERPQ